jgi:hypothetical protein
MKLGTKMSLRALPLAIMLLVVSACAAGAADGPAFPTGTFVSEADGDVEYRFEDNGRWSYHAFGLTGAEGRYAVKGNVWTEQGGEDCPFPGSYEWTFDGSRLAFTLVGEDACDGRRQATDGQAFILQK